MAACFRWKRSSRIICASTASWSGARRCCLTWSRRTCSEIRPIRRRNGATGDEPAKARALLPVMSEVLMETQAERALLEHALPQRGSFVLIGDRPESAKWTNDLLALRP